MLPWRSIGFLVYFFGMSAASLVMPILGVANYMLIYQIFPEHTWWHIPLQPLAIRYSMTAAVFMIAGMLLTLPRMRLVRPTVSLWDLCALGLVFVVVLSEFVGLGPGRASSELVEKFVKMMVFIFCMTRITTSRTNYTIIVWALVLGSIYIGYDAWTAPKSAFARGRLDHVGGPDFRHSSGLAAHMSMMLPLIGVTLMSNRRYLLKAVAGISAILTFNTIVLCRTRSAFVGLICGTFVGAMLLPKRARLKTVTALVFALIGANYLTDVHYWERMSTLKNKETISHDPAAMYRLQIWHDAMEIIRDNPLGIGVGNFVPTIAKKNPNLGRRAAHNTFILCWTELGYQGFALFLTLWATAFLQAWYCYRRAEQTENPVWTRYMAYGLLVSMVVCASTQMFTERLYTEAFWWILALPGCLKRIVIRESAQLQQAAKVPTEPDLIYEPGFSTTGGLARGAFA